jgi:hypothetical protein
MALQFRSYAGTIYAAPVDADGVLQGGYIDLGEVQPMSFKAETNQQTRKSRKYDTAGQIVATRNEIDGTEGSMTLHQANARNLAYALSGSYTELTGTSGSVSGEAVTAPEPGEGVRLANRDISNVVVTGHTVDVDYTVDELLGILTPIIGGGISASDALTVDYDYAAQSGYRVQIATNAMTRVALYGKLLNEFTNETEFLELDKVVLAASSEINFISEEGSEGEQFQFTLSLETITGNTSPGRIDGVPM